MQKVSEQTKTTEVRNWASGRKPDFWVDQTPVWRAPDDDPESFLTYWYSIDGPTDYGFDVRGLPGYTKAPDWDSTQKHHATIITVCIRSSVVLGGSTESHD